MWSILRGKKAINRNWFWVGPAVVFGKTSKAVITNMFKEHKDTMFKELKENVVTMTQQTGALCTNRKHKKRTKSNSRVENTILYEKITRMTP